ncbi:MAG: hypothetical protein EOP54_16950, partial [Sphingobacteriales bacterium]
MTRFFMCSLALLLFCSCMETRIEYVAKKSDVLQKAYAADKPLLDSFAKHLLAIKELQDDLKVKMDTLVADSLDLGIILEKVMLDEVTFTGKLTAANFLSVHNTGNIRQYFIGQGNATYNFGLSMLDTVVDDVTTDVPLSLWTAHLGGYSEGEYKDNDSLSTYGLKDYNAKLAREKEQIKNVKYLVCIHDKLLVQPKAIDNKSDHGVGVALLVGVDQYQQNMRSAKYAILIISLTFIALFFTELLSKTKVHLLQYVLIGGALTIYYTLLIALSEQIGFDWAYAIASFATISLIGFFIAKLLKSIKPAILLTTILTLFYCFVYVIIQLQDFAL